MAVCCGSASDAWWGLEMVASVHWSSSTVSVSNGYIYLASCKTVHNNCASGSKKMHQAYINFEWHH